MECVVTLMVVLCVIVMLDLWVWIAVKVMGDDVTSSFIVVIFQGVLTIHMVQIVPQLVTVQMELTAVQRLGFVIVLLAILVRLVNLVRISHNIFCVLIFYLYSCMH